MFRVNRLAAALLAAGLLAGASGASATQIININSGSQWLSTTDALVATQWFHGNFTVGADGVPATAPYPNLVTTPNDIVPGTSAQLMWACGPGSTLCDNTGTNGPTEVWFGMPLDLKANPIARLGAAQIIADDYFEFIVNGQFVQTGYLDDHQNPVSGQPVPIGIDFTSYLHDGYNWLMIHALDGYFPTLGAACDPGYTDRPVQDARGTFCAGDRIFEFAFVDGVIVSVPVPMTAALMGAGLLGLVRRRNRPATGAMRLMA